MLEMNADLVGPAGMEDGFNQRGSAEPFQDPVRGSRSSPHVLIHSHSLAVRRMPRDGSPDFPALPLNFAAHNRVISLIHAPTRELCGQCDMSIVDFCDQ